MTHDSWDRVSVRHRAGAILAWAAFSGVVAGALAVLLYWSVWLVKETFG